MITTDVIQYYHPAPSPCTINRNIDISHIVNGPGVAIIRDLGLELSSPEANYDAQLSQSKERRVIQVRHKKTDQERRMLSKMRTATLEEWLESLEEARKEIEKKFEEAEKHRKETEKKQEEIITWEIWDRIAQGINDFLKRAIHQSLRTANPDLKKAACILSDRTPYHYLPALFTKWWIYWNQNDSIKHELPLALRSLQLRPTRRNPPLPDDLEIAAQTLWYSRYQPLIEVMLAAYHARPKERNPIQHPIPSTHFALEFTRSSELNLSTRSKPLSKPLVSAIINLGINSKTEDKPYLFSRPIEEDPYPGEGLDRLDGEIENILRPKVTTL